MATATMNPSTTDDLRARLDRIRGTSSLSKPQPSAPPTSVPSPTQQNAASTLAEKQKDYSTPTRPFGADQTMQSNNIKLPGDIVNAPDRKRTQNGPPGYQAPPPQSQPSPPTNQPPQNQPTMPPQQKPPSTSTSSFSRKDRMAQAKPSPTQSTTSSFGGGSSSSNNGPSAPQSTSEHKFAYRPDLDDVGHMRSRLQNFINSGAIADRPPPPQAQTTYANANSVPSSFFSTNTATNALIADQSKKFTPSTSQQQGNTFGFGNTSTQNNTSTSTFGFGTSQQQASNGNAPNQNHTSSFGGMNAQTAAQNIQQVMNPASSHWHSPWRQGAQGSVNQPYTSQASQSLEENVFNRLHASVNGHPNTPSTDNKQQSAPPITQAPAPTTSTSQKQDTTPENKGVVTRIQEFYRGVDEKTGVADKSVAKKRLLITVITAVSIVVGLGILGVSAMYFLKWRKQGANVQSKPSSPIIEEVNDVATKTTAPNPPTQVVAPPQHQPPIAPESTAATQQMTELKNAQSNQLRQLTTDLIKQINHRFPQDAYSMLSVCTM